MNTEEILRQAAQAAEHMNGNTQPPQVSPQPVPMSFRIAQANLPDGQMGVVLMVATPVGEAVYFLDAKTAGGVADGLKQASSAAASGLLIPGG